MKKFTWALGAMLALPAAAAAPSKFTTANNEFGDLLFKKSVASEKQADTNVLISPLSAFVALSMAQAGAEGDTRKEIATALQLAGISKEDLNKGVSALVSSLLGRKSEEKIHLANSIWANSNFFNFSQGFKNDIGKYYNPSKAKDVPAYSFPFSDPSTVVKLNQWCSDNTEKLIPTILEELDDDMAAILLNAIFFESKWLQPFEKHMTYETKTARADAGQVTSFTSAAKKSIDVMMMVQPELNAGHAAAKDFDMVSLPFCGKSAPQSPGSKDLECTGKGNFVLDLILPSTKTDARKLAASLTGKDYQKAVAALQDETLELHVPKFKYAYTEEGPKLLNDFLQEMDMKRAFQSGRAEFKPMGESSRETPYISAVLQKAVVEMEEGGFKAAAVTAVVARAESVALPQKAVKFDRAFLFALRDTQTGSVLFRGLVASPKW